MVGKRLEIKHGKDLYVYTRNKGKKLYEKRLGTICSMKGGDEYACMLALKPETMDLPCPQRRPGRPDLPVYTCPYKSRLPVPLIRHIVPERALRTRKAAHPEAAPTTTFRNFKRMSRSDIEALWKESGALLVKFHGKLWGCFMPQEE